MENFVYGGAYGPSNRLSGLNIYNQVGHSKAPMSNGSIEQFATNDYPSIISLALKGFTTSPPTVCDPTTIIVRT